MTGTSTTTSTTSSVEQKDGGAPRLGEWIIVAAMLVFFGGAYVLAQDWPFRAALFPQGVAGAGFALSVIRLVSLLLHTRRGRSAQGVAVTPSTRAAELAAQPQSSSPESEMVRTAAAAGEEKQVAEEGAAENFEIVDDEQEDDASMEYVFASAGGRAWAEALGWIVAFFVSFFVLGAYITVPLFALIYLIIAGKAKWWAAALYAVVTGVLIFVVFRDVVFIPLPESVFPFLDF